MIMCLFNCSGLVLLVAGTSLVFPSLFAAAGVSPTDRSPDPQSRPGPWDHDVLVFRVERHERAQPLGRFERAGVPTLVRLKDGRLVAAHQHFPESSLEDFDKVAVRFSPDDGQTWTAPEVIRLTGLPEGMRFPFDPTLLPLPDGRVRLYFTSLKGRRFDENRPAIYSAISSNSVDYLVEPGVRFGVEGRPVIDCAVVLHQGVFHLFAPDNGAGGPPGAPGGERRSLPDRPRDGAGYHATSRDGLVFLRVEDAQIEGRRRWLGCAQSDGTNITFYGTGEDGIWMSESSDGGRWSSPRILQDVRGADPGVVTLRDGSRLVVATGAPRPGTPSARQRPPLREGGPPPRGEPIRPRGAANPPRREPTAGIRELEVDAGRPIGEIRSLLGVNRGPYSYPRRPGEETVSHVDSYRRLGIDFIRTHDFYGPTDWQMIFPEWSADPDAPASYDFIKDLSLKHQSTSPIPLHPCLTRHSVTPSG